MSKPTLSERVGTLEQKVEILETLPGRVTAVELQILQLREEMRGEFIATRRETAELLGVMRDGLHAEMGAMRDGLRDEMGAVRDGLRDELRVEIREGDEETRRLMRVLHEDVIARIATLQELMARRPKK